MKNIKIISIVLIILINLFLELISFIDLNLLLTNPIKYDFRYDLIILSSITSILAAFAFNGNYYKFLHIVWLIPCAYMFFFFTKTPRTFEELDFYFSKKVEFRVEQHIENKWFINYIIIDKDTIYYNQNESWNEHEELLSQKDLKRLEVRKSLTQNYYHLRLNEK